MSRLAVGAFHASEATCHVRTRRVVLAQIVLVVALACIGTAQNFDPATGSPPFISSVKGQFDTLNLPYGNVLVEFPVRFKAGKYPVTHSLVGNSRAFIGAPPNGNYTGQWHVSWGFQGATAGSLFSTNLGTIATPEGGYDLSSCGQWTQGDPVYPNWYAREADGTMHPFPTGMVVDLGGCLGSSASGTTTDSSGYTLQLNVVNAGLLNAQLQITLWDKAGNLLQSPKPWPASCNNVSSCVTDPDGISMYGYTGSGAGGPIVETLGQTLITATIGNHPSPDTYVYNDISGHAQTVYVYYTQIPMLTAFGCANIAEQGFQYAPLPTSVAYADGETISITYEQNSLAALPGWKASVQYLFGIALLDSNGNLEAVVTGGKSGTSQPVWNTAVGGSTTDGTVVWHNYGKTWTSGRVGSITYPQGGSVTYTYSGVSCTAGTGWPTQITRTVNDNRGTSSMRTYQISAPSSNHSTVTVTETDPVNNVTVLYFEGATTLAGNITTCTSSYSNLCTYTYIQTEKLSYNGAASASNLIGMQVTCYNGNNANESGCITPSKPIFFPVSQTDAYTHMIGFGGAIEAASDSQSVFDGYGNVTSGKSYDFGTGFPPSGSPLSTTSTVYDSAGTCGTLANAAVHDRPCSVTVSGPSGQVSQVKYTYNAGGHPTQTSTLVSGTTYLMSNATYNANGTIASFTDVNPQATTNYYYNGTGGCNNLLLTSTSFPVDNLADSQMWDCNGGVITSSTDANGQTTAYRYDDPRWRVTSVTDPLQNVTTYSYTTNTVDTRMLFNSNASVDEKVQTVDGLGRVHVSQQRLGPSATSYDSVETDYDANGRVSRVTLPYSGGLSATNSTIGGTATTYDALNRPLTVKDAAGKQVSYQYNGRDAVRSVLPVKSGDGTFSSQLEYDGLGRLTSICEITGGTTAWPGGACGQVQQQPQTGYLTTHAYDPLGHLTTVTQNAQSSATQTRSFSFDGLGRLNSELNPETGQNAPGTTAYTYDSDSTGACAGPFNGDLVKRVDNAGDVTCYAYDNLHRVTSVTYPSGPKAASTKKKTFVYDTTTFSCPNGANVAGRLAKAYTGSTSVSTGYCYSPRGEITDVYQSTPHSGGYAHFSVSYWANGQLDVLSGFPSNLPTFTYGLDGEGRPKTVTASSGQNPVSSVTYNSAEQVTNVTFGSNDKDVYSINSGRLTRYTHYVNGTQVYGTLNWNTNGTLGSLGITDPLNGADAQTCTYHYDDLTRVSSANCGASIWQQNFSYDPFGNVTKQVPTGGTGISWQPGYSSTTNHYTLAGTSYDADGNVMNDTFNSYAWDAEANMITLNSSTTNTFDAFGNIVETGPSAGPWTQFLYLPEGIKVLGTMSSATTLQKAFIPLPGGGQAVYNGSTLAYYRHADWMGSSRMATTPSTPSASYFDGGYAPFGESYATSGTTDLMFADHTQDVVAGGLYDTLNRKYHPRQGRWISPDPGGLQVADPSNPQTWNRYAYVLNNPLSFVDPSGLECVWDDGSWDSAGDPDTGNFQNCTAAGGNWVDHSYFEQNGLPDWSADPNPAIASYVKNFVTTITAQGPDAPDPVAVQSSMRNYMIGQLTQLIPRVCGYGGFGYGGGAFDLWKGHAEGLALVEYDSSTGGGHGGLFGVGWGKKTFGVESIRNWSNWQSSTTPIGIGGPEFQMPGKLKGMKGDVGGFFQLDNGQLNIGGYAGGHGVKAGRAVGAGGYLRLSWSGC